MERFIWHCNQVSCTLLFFDFLLFGYSFQVNCSSPFHHSSPKTTHSCPPEQSLALLQFKSNTYVSSAYYSFCNEENSSPKTNSWTEGTDCCSWDGVTCDNVTGNVIGLDHHSSYGWLLGTIDDNSTSFISPISNLSTLLIAISLAFEFGRLKELTYLNLSASDFGGLLPHEMSHLSKLTHLDLSFCVLTIKQKTFDLLASNLTKLSLLHLGATNMSLIKPFSLLNLSSTMTDLDLGGTKIKGNFPDDIFRLPNLQILYLNLNSQLTGYLPKSNWSSPLGELDLSLSNFLGEIPYSIGNLFFLEVLDIGFCNFIGSFPISIGNPTRATEIVLASNHFTGQLPHHVSGLSYLTTFDLSGNYFQGRVPSWLFTLPSLLSIDLSKSMLNGPIDPFQWPNSLQDVRLKENEIHGTIPNSIFQLVSLTNLNLSPNNLSGAIRFDQFSKLKNLQFLDLSNNSLLSFTSSASIFIEYSLPSLTILRFSNCNISKFPSFLRNSENLRVLELSNSRIYGRISKYDSQGWKSFDCPCSFQQFFDTLVPPPSTEVFLVSNNKLSRQIPPICSLSSLRHLSLSHNNLSGTIPPCLGNFSTELVILHLKNNSLEGHIDDTYANASHLRSLDLNSNKLEGPLPRSLAKCIKLEVVNVGNNMISDSFPCWLGSLPELKNSCLEL